jgi:hypothetical protein
MKLTLLDFDPSTQATTTAYGTITLNADGGLTAASPNIAGLIRVKTCVANAMQAVIRASKTKTPTNAQVLEYLATSSPKAANGRVIREG